MCQDVLSADINYDVHHNGYKVDALYSTLTELSFQFVEKILIFKYTVLINI